MTAPPISRQSPTRDVWLKRIVRVSLFGLPTDCRVQATRHAEYGRTFLYAVPTNSRPGDTRPSWVPADRVLWWTDARETSLSY